MYRELDNIEEGYDVINGLCIRVLNRYLLSELMSYLIEPRPEAAAAKGATAAALRGDENVHVTGLENDHTRDLALVSKYWCHVALSTRAFGPAERSVVEERPGYGPRWDRGVEVGLPYSKQHLEKNDVVEEMVFSNNEIDTLDDIHKKDSEMYGHYGTEQENFDEAMVTPTHGVGDMATPLSRSLASKGLLRRT